MEPARGRIYHPFKENRRFTIETWAMKQNPGWLFDIGIKLPNDMRITINQL